MMKVAHEARTNLPILLEHAEGIKELIIILNMGDIGLRAAGIITRLTMLLGPGISTAALITWH
jgi:hypothetical protein